jgi:hypothetical protein
LPGIEPVSLGCKATAGKIYYFDGSMDKCRTQKSKKIARFDGEVFSDDVFSDPIIERMAREGTA